MFFELLPNSVHNFCFKIKFCWQLKKKNYLRILSKLSTVPGHKKKLVYSFTAVIFTVSRKMKIPNWNAAAFQEQSRRRGKMYIIYTLQLVQFQKGEKQAYKIVMFKIFKIFKALPAAKKYLWNNLRPSETVSDFTRDKKQLDCGPDYLQEKFKRDSDPRERNPSTCCPEAFDAWY